ncbi:MAG: glycosyltransferase family 2 protein [Candidatus Latescibacteria bacterium]|nr:glycosyltransferase family 2 protein [Candidatus Latescibacterota bacterium]
MNPASPPPLGLSVVIPVYNEEESLPPLCEKLGIVLDRLPFASEVIFVDDGSTDHSFAVIQSLHQRDPRIRAVGFRRNYRKAAALAAGFREAQGEFILTMDADLQDDPEEIPRLLEALDAGLDLVSGWKKKRRDPLNKTLPSRFFNLVTSLVSGIRLHDFNCGLKLYRREVAEDCLPYLYGELYRFLPAMAHWAGYRVGELPVQHHPRCFGKSKFGAKRLLNGFLDLLTITFVVRFMTMPMHIFGSLGLVAALAGGGICTYIAYLRFVYGNIQNHHPLLMLGMLLVIVGIQLFSTGLLGDMLASLHQRQSRTVRLSRRVGDPPA